MKVCRAGMRGTACALAALLCALTGCGSEEGGTAGGGEVQPPWDAYCVATFSEDYAFIDGFGDVEWRVKRGGRYLLADTVGFGAEATVLFLSGRGPVEFAIDVEPGGALPFTSSCAEGAVEELVGVFADTTIYADEGLTMSACMLTAGTALHGGGLSYALVSGDLFAGGGTYQVAFGGLDQACSGLTAGYVEASSVMIGSTEHTVLPLASVLGPSQ